MKKTNKQIIEEQAEEIERLRKVTELKTSKIEKLKTELDKYKFLAENYAEILKDDRRTYSISAGGSANSPTPIRGCILPEPTKSGISIL